MQEKSRGASALLLQLFLKTSLSIIILLFIWLAIVNLPMLDEISFPLEFTLPEMLAATIFTIISIILINFGLRLEIILRYYSTKAPHFAMAVRQVFFMAAILILYFFYRPLFVPYLNGLDYIYHLAFLVASLTVLSILGIAIYRSIEDLAKSISGSKQKRFSAAPIIKCSSCGAPIKRLASFCPTCGETVTAAQSKIDLDLDPTCNTCNAPLNSGAKFCTNCGQSQ